MFGGVWFAFLVRVGIFVMGTVSVGTVEMVLGTVSVGTVVIVSTEGGERAAAMRMASAATTDIGRN